MKRFAIVALAALAEVEARKRGRGNNRRGKKPSKNERNIEKSEYLQFISKMKGQGLQTHNSTSEAEFDKRMECFMKNK